MNKTKTHKITFNVSKEIKNKLKRIARKEERSMNAQFIKLVAEIPEEEKGK